MQRGWWGWQCEKHGSSTAWRIYSPSPPLTEGTGAAWLPSRWPPRQRMQSQALPEAHSSHTRESAVLCSALWDFTLGTVPGCSSTDLAKHSITLAYKTPCDFEVTVIITEQAQKSNSSPEPQKLFQSSCPRAFPAPEATFLLKDT